MKSDLEALVKKYGMNIYDGESFIHIINSDGSENQPVMLDNGKGAWGDYPMWSPDGSKIAYWGGVVDLASGKLLKGLAVPVTWGAWGKKKIVGWVGQCLWLNNTDTFERTILLEVGERVVPENMPVEEVW